MNTAAIKHLQVLRALLVDQLRRYPKSTYDYKRCTELLPQLDRKIAELQS